MEKTGLSVKAAAIAGAVVWAGGVLFVTAAHLVWTGYGTAFVQLLSSIYPGYDPATGASSIVIGTLWAASDGAIAGALFAWVYNKCCR